MSPSLPLCGSPRTSLGTVFSDRRQGHCGKQPPCGSASPRREKQLTDLAAGQGHRRPHGGALCPGDRRGRWQNAPCWSVPGERLAEQAVGDAGTRPRPRPRHPAPGTSPCGLALWFWLRLRGAPRGEVTESGAGGPWDGSARGSAPSSGPGRCRHPRSSQSPASSLRARCDSCVSGWGFSAPHSVSL